MFIKSIELIAKGFRNSKMKMLSPQFKFFSFMLRPKNNCFGPNVESIVATRRRERKDCVCSPSLCCILITKLLSFHFVHFIYKMVTIFSFVFSSWLDFF